MAPPPSNLDLPQILQAVHDEATGTLRTTATAVIVGGELEVIINEASDSIQIYGNDGVNNQPIKTDTDGNLQVDVLSSALPAGAATEAKQDAGNASLVSIDSKLTSPLTVTSTNLDIRDLVFATDKVDISGSSVNQGTSPWIVDGSATTQPISAVSLPLPTGASTSALQTTGNASLSSIDTKLTTTNSSLASIDAGIPVALGQTTSANSMPVVIASDQTALPVSQSGTWILGSNSGVDIGDVTINNAAGASAVNIQDGGNSITVDGTVSATQSGTWTVQPGNTANTTPWLTTDTADGPVTPGTVATKSQLMGGQYNSTLPTLTNTQQSAVQLDSSGRLLTTTNISSVASTVAPSLSSKIKSEPTFTTIAIPSSVSYTTLYTYSGSGYFLGFNLEFNNTAIVVKVVIDGNTVMDGVDISQYNSLAATSGSSAKYQFGLGLITAASVMDFSTRYPIAYTSSVVISARLTSGATSRNFNQGLFIYKRILNMNENLEVTWDIFKTFIENKKLSIQFFDVGNIYCMWAFDGPFTLKCKLYKDNSEDVLDFENNFKNDSNKKLEQKDSDGSPLIRTKITNTGWNYKLHGLEFETSTLNSIVENKLDGTPYNFTAIKFYDSDNNLLTTQETIDSSCIKTLIDWEPTHDYEIVGGFFKIASIPTEDVYFYVVGVPDVPEIYGGSKMFVSNINLKFIGLEEGIKADGRASKLLKYDPIYHTNKLRIVLKHSAGYKQKMNIIYEFFKP